MRGSCSELNSGISGKGNNSSLTPDKAKAPPIPIAALVKNPAPAKEPFTVAALKKAPAVTPPVANANPINAAPPKILPTPLPAPLITGIKCISS